MGLLDGLKDQLAGALGGVAGQAGSNQLVASLVQHLNDPAHGGLQGLVQAFHDKGLGNIVSSWVGTGSNLPVSAAQVSSVLGSGKLEQLAQSAGIAPGTIAQQLSALLPHLVDHLTPGGTMPQAGALQQGLSSLLSGPGLGGLLAKLGGGAPR